MTWYQFDDCNSGNERKTPWQYIHIEADDESAARDRFEWLTGFSSYREYCACCGDDYDVSLTVPDSKEASVIVAAGQDFTPEQVAEMDAFGGVYQDDWRERLERRTA